MSNVRQLASANASARFDESSDLPSPAPGLEIVTTPRPLASNECITARRIVRNASRA